MITRDNSIHNGLKSVSDRLRDKFVEDIIKTNGMEIANTISIVRHLWIQRNEYVFQSRLIPLNKTNFITMQNYELF